MEIDKLIKGLKSQLKNKVDELELIKHKKRIQKDYNTKRDEITTLNQKIKNIEESNKDIVVSEHDILRYLERVKGIDIEELKKEIITEQVENLVNVLGGNGKYPNNNIQLIMKNFTVTTKIIV